MLGLAGLLIATAVLQTSREPTTLEVILDRGVLKMVTFQSSTTYYQDARGEGGFEYVLAKSFADSLGVELEVTVFSDLNTLLLSVGGTKADFAAAGLTVTLERLKYLRFTDPYDFVTQKLIYRRGNRKPSPEESIGDQTLVVVAGSSHVENLEKAKEQYPFLTWEEQNADSLELMAKVHSGEIDLTVVDSNAYLVNRSLYPRATEAFDITEPEPLAWAFPRYGDESLVNAANRFLRDFRESGKLAKLKQQMLGHADRFSAYGSRVFTKRLETRLPKYQPLFKQASEKYDLDWHLIAAIAYQESHWDPKAVSPTGVRGLMMLTLAAAKEMEVTDREDPAQSIDGGTRYFLYTRNRLPDDIYEPDRTWLALAAYNVGMGHLEDARVLTDRAGKDPHLWKDVMEYLPLLQQEKYYSTVKHGFARGAEPVQYVQNVRHYRSILQWYSLENDRNKPAEAPTEKQTPPKTLENILNRPMLPL
ncbi:MAG: membrane-bound lytic murein transglycosylase MltF [bacterium]